MKHIFSVMASLMSGLCALAITPHSVPTTHIPSPAPVTVALPASYADSVSERFPVVYLLNGHGGNEKSWSTVIDLDSMATAYNTIIVCPAGLTSWYWNSPVDSTLQMEDYIIKDLVPWVDASFRTRADRSGRAISGFSMGGHGALWLATRHSDVFANAGASSGGVDIRPFPENWDMARRLGARDENPERWDSHTVMTAVENLKPGMLNIIFDCGSEDFFYEVNNNLHRKLTEMGIAHTYLTQHGAHNAAYWNRAVVPQFQFFRTQFYVE